MRIYELDCGEMTTREQAHACLRRTLELPSYYGCNLDALYDCLTEISCPSLLRLNNVAALEVLGDYGRKLLDTLRDAAEENPFFALAD